MTQQEDITKLDEALQLLVEHYDAVHIFATRHEPTTEGGTIKCQKGIGNWFARYGQVREWIISEEETMREAMRKRET